jgi:hypothetical protein
VAQAAHAATTAAPSPKRGPKAGNTVDLAERASGRATRDALNDEIVMIDSAGASATPTL